MEEEQVLFPEVLNIEGTICLLRHVNYTCYWQLIYSKVVALYIEISKLIFCVIKDENNATADGTGLELKQNEDTEVLATDAYGPFVLGL
jgi:hypothetical protein